MTISPLFLMLVFETGFLQTSHELRLAFYSLDYHAETGDDIHFKIIFVGNIGLGASLLINSISCRFTGFYVSDIRINVYRDITGFSNNALEGLVLSISNM
ncbi:hypothetical protein H8356DRAFT_1359204 [Neocallimastix lanati (nom. inval.)]|nr:hypothetical protein H8356DRAFT_1359204 [Neocallimastix sp. JGI-2020a]